MLGNNLLEEAAKQLCHVFPLFPDPTDANMTPADKKTKKPSAPTTESEFPKHAALFPKKGVLWDLCVSHWCRLLFRSLFIACERGAMLLVPRACSSKPATLFSVSDHSGIYQGVNRGNVENIWATLITFKILIAIQANKLDSVVGSLVFKRLLASTF